MPRMIDASTTATGARERPGERGGCLDDAAASAFWPKDQEGGARRRTGGGSRSQTSHPWPPHAPPPGGSVPAVAVGQRRWAGRAVRPDRGRGALRSAAGQGGGAGRGERQLFVERPALPGPRRSSRGAYNPSASSGGLTTRLIDASATGEREGPGRGGGYPLDVAVFYLGGREGRARRRNCGGSLSRRGRMVQRTATAGPRWRSSLCGETLPPIETPHRGGRLGRSEGRAERGQGGALVVAGATLKSNSVL